MLRYLSFVLIFIHHQVAEMTSACGVPVISNRIVGGMDSKRGEWPWQISLSYKSDSICGGSLLTDSWVMTAAHCIDSLDVSYYTVYLGAYQLSAPNNSTVSRGVKSITKHPDFQYEGSSGDIALIELEKPVTFTPYILPICLPSQDVQFAAGTMCWVTGWGNIQEGTPLSSPKTIQKAEVAIIDSSVCETMYESSLGYIPDFSFIQEDMVCAGYKEGRIDACQGDSGGPLVCNVNNVWLQLGIVSWGYGCAEPNRPGVYTKVQYYQDWLKTNVPLIVFSEEGPSVAPSIGPSIAPSFGPSLGPRGVASTTISQTEAQSVNSIEIDKTNSTTIFETEAMSMSNNTTMNETFSLVSSTISTALRINETKTIDNEAQIHACSLHTIALTLIYLFIRFFV
ncbi:hypothetical protein XELAEV_18001642mg [Xenopus laevis]|nr:hypothetical protein XELAEV_18001642mg [Xenopus laevis]